MPLIYSFVARGNVVLADYTSYTGNFSTVALQVSQRHKRVPEADRFAGCSHQQRSEIADARYLRRPCAGAARRLQSGPCAADRPPPHGLQALEKGGQGANAKFTYSCDGHSEWRCFALLDAGSSAFLSVLHGGADRSRPSPPSGACSLQLPVIKWIQ